MAKCRKHGWWMGVDTSQSSWCPECRKEKTTFDKALPPIHRCEKHHKYFSESMCPECADDLMDSIIALNEGRERNAYEDSVYYVIVKK